MKINIQNLETGSRPCKSLYHQDINKVLCHGNLSAYVRIFEFPFLKRIPLPRDCLCSDGEGVTPFSFTSTGHVVEVHFEVFNMNAMDDFRSFHFEGSWEFVRQTVCTRSQKLKGPSGEIQFNSLSRNSEDVSKILKNYEKLLIKPILKKMYN